MFSIGLLGAGGAGKTCLAFRFLHDEFHQYYNPTMDEVYEAKVVFQGKHLEYELLDTAGQEELATGINNVIQKSQGIVLCYCIDSTSSWNSLMQIKTNILNIKNIMKEKIPLLIVGCKSDLEIYREVDRNIVEEYASLNNLPFVETSAKSGENVQLAFEMILEEMQQISPELLVEKKKERKKRCQIC